MAEYKIWAYKQDFQNFTFSLKLYKFDYFVLFVTCAHWHTWLSNVRVGSLDYSFWFSLQKNL